MSPKTAVARLRSVPSLVNKSPPSVAAKPLAKRLQRTACEKVSTELIGLEQLLLEANESLSAGEMELSDICDGD